MIYHSAFEAFDIEIYSSVLYYLVLVFLRYLWILGSSPELDKTESHTVTDVLITKCSLWSFVRYCTVLLFLLELTSLDLGVALVELKLFSGRKCELDNNCLFCPEDKPGVIFRFVHCARLGPVFRKREKYIECDILESYKLCQFHFFCSVCVFWYDAQCVYVYIWFLILADTQWLIIVGVLSTLVLILLILLIAVCVYFTKCREYPAHKVIPLLIYLFVKLLCSFFVKITTLKHQLL